MITTENLRLLRLEPYDNDHACITAVRVDLLNVRLKYRRRISKELDSLRRLALETIIGLGEGKECPLEELKEVTGLPTVIVGRLVDDLIQLGLACGNEHSVNIAPSVSLDNIGVSMEVDDVTNCFALGVVNESTAPLAAGSIDTRRIERIEVEKVPEANKPNVPPKEEFVPILPSESTLLDITDVSRRRYTSRIEMDKVGEASSTFMILLLGTQIEYPFEINPDHLVAIWCRNIVERGVSSMKLILADYGEWEDGRLLINANGWRRWKKIDGRIKNRVLMTFGEAVLSLPVSLSPSSSAAAKDMHVDLMLDILSQNSTSLDSNLIKRLANDTAKALGYPDLPVPDEEILTVEAWDSGRWELAYRLQAEGDGL